MTDFMPKTEMKRKLVKVAMLISDVNNKNGQDILKAFKKNGFLVNEGETDFSKIINRLKVEDYIKETKDRYLLTERGKKEVEKYKNLPWYLRNG